MSYKTPKKYFVTQHRGAIKWAAQSGVKARTIEMANFNVNEVVQGDVVIGTLPVHLAARVIQRDVCAIRGKGMSAISPISNATSKP